MKQGAKDSAAVESPETTAESTDGEAVQSSPANATSEAAKSSAAGAVEETESTDVDNDQETKPEADAKPDDSPPEEPEKPKKSAAEVIAELRDSVEAMRDQFNDVEKLVSVCKVKLVKEADAYRLEGMKPLLESVMLIHDLVFRHAQAMEAGDVAPDHFVLNLLETIEAELSGENIEVIRPQPGDEPDLAVMKTIGTAKCPFYRKADRVARVHSCGFAIRMEGTALILRKAEITVYRKQP